MIDASVESEELLEEMFDEDAICYHGCPDPAWYMFCKFCNDGGLLCDEHKNKSIAGLEKISAVTGFVICDDCKTKGFPHPFQWRKI